MLAGHWGTSVPLSDIVDTPIWWLDAGNPASYPGTGTVWTDLMGNFHFNAEGAATFDATVGALAVDGANSWLSAADYLGTWLRGLGSNDTPFTLEFWLRAVDQSYQMMMGSGNFAAGNGLQPHFATGSSGSYRPYLSGGNSSSSYFDTPIPVGVWEHVTWSGVCDGATASKLYVNGVQSGASKVLANLGFADSTNRVRLGHSGSKDYGTTYGMAAGTKYAVVRGYSRILTADEIAQNFAAERNRFGV